MDLDKDAVLEFVDDAVDWYEEESLLGNGVTVRTDGSHKVPLNECREVGKTDANSLNRLRHASLQTTERNYDHFDTV